MSANPLHDSRLERTTLSLLLTIGGLDAEEATNLLEASGLQPEDLTVPALREVLEGTRSALRARQPLTLDSVHAELRAAKQYLAAGAGKFLAELFNESSSTLGSNFMGNVRNLKGLALRRTALETARKIAQQALDFAVDAEELPVNGARLFSALRSTGDGLTTMERDLEELLADLDDAHKGRTTPAIKTGVEMWDKLIGGLIPEVVTFLGAQPGVGKSALLGRIIVNLAMRGERVGFFSLEDRPKWLSRRALSATTRIPVRKLATERPDSAVLQQMQEAAGEAYAWHRNVIRCPPSRVKPGRLAQLARSMILNHGCRVIVLDHLGEVDVRGDGKSDRHDLRVDEAIVALRDVATDYRVPVLVAAHFKRPANGDTDPRFVRPSSTSWGESAYIERKARVAVGGWLEKGKERRMYLTALKATLGKPNVDFWVPFDPTSSLVLNEGGDVAKNDKGEEGKGYDEDDEPKARQLALVE